MPLSAANPASASAKTGASPAVPMFWAQPVAWDGYLDVAIVKINRIYDGPEDPSSATVAGPDDWDFLPQVPLGDSSALSSGQDIEFTFAARAWSNTNPLDPGTCDVVRDGFRILVDKELLLQRLARSIAAAR